jgi:nucleotide-binding universal stress UspA family protein
MTITRILVPTDFSADAEVAVAHAAEFAQRFGAAVHLLHVVDDTLAAGMWSSEMYTAEVAGLQVNLVKDAEQRIRQATLPTSGVPLHTEVRTGRPAATIVEAARELSADLIVMGTTGRTGVAHLLLGSVAERVVRTAPCPVLTIRSKAERG